MVKQDICPSRFHWRVSKPMVEPLQTLTRLFSSIYWKIALTRGWKFVQTTQTFSDKTERTSLRFIVRS